MKDGVRGRPLGARRRDGRRRLGLVPCDDDVDDRRAFVHLGIEARQDLVDSLAQAPLGRRVVDVRLGQQRETYEFHAEHLVRRRLERAEQAQETDRMEHA